MQGQKRFKPACLKRSLKKNLNILMTSSLSGVHGDIFYRHGITLYHRQLEYDKALKYLLLAAELKSPDAMYTLGALCGGKGIPGIMDGHNYPLAIYWLKKAAKHGSVKAMFNLGLFMSNLIDLKTSAHVNPTEALGWFEKAIEKSQPREIPQAMMAIGAMAQTGCVNGSRINGRWVNGSRDEKKALEWYQRAAHAGHVQGMYHTALLLMKVAQQEEQAIHWFYKAATQGDRLSIKALAILARQNSKSSIKIK
jgi:TPR repeat protein